MDIERLKELRKSLNAENWNAKTKIEVIALTDDLIARQSATSDEVSEAIEELMSGIWQSYKDGYPITLGDKTIGLAITALQAYQPWISVDDRLPAEEDADGNANVMCLFADNAIETWAWNEITEWNLDDARKEQVFAGITHWRPMLPEPPKGE